MVLIAFVAGSIWLVLRINDFSRRLKATEKLCDDIHTRQLPEIRTELKEIRNEMNERFSKMEEKISQINLQLNTIVTYLQAKGNKINL